MASQFPAPTMSIFPMGILIFHTLSLVQSFLVSFIFTKLIFYCSRRQIVTYKADPYSGYVADVKFEGEAKYPEVVPWKPVPYKSAEPTYKPQAYAPKYEPKYEAPKESYVAKEPTYQAPKYEQKYEAPPKYEEKYEAPKEVYVAKEPVYQAPTYNKAPAY